jgi:SdrD B-like protein
MKTKVLIAALSALLIVALIVLIPGCDRSKYPTESQSMQTQPSGGFRATTPVANIPQSVVLEGFTVTYLGRSLANNQTTFSYLLTGPNIDVHFRLELPGCAGALASASPGNGVTSNNDANIDPGIEWHPSNGTNKPDSILFSLTYAGTIKEGIILTSVNTNAGTEVGLIAGACARVFDISGSVFTDANNNGIRDGSETGIGNVTVRLLNSLNAVIASRLTDANGNYLFEQVLDGTYTVTTDTGTVATTSTTYLNPTTPTSISVTGGPDSPGHNFGFAAKSNKLINDLKFGLLPTTGFTPGFWKKQLASAISGGGSPTVSKAQLLTYIASIRGLLLTEPFQLGTGDGLQAAYDILNKPVKTDLDALTQQLLALEFNHVSGHGILATDPSLQLILIGWGEALVAGAQPAGGTATMSVVPGATIMSLYTDATTVYGGIDKSAGGGGSIF